MKSTAGRILLGAKQSNVRGKFHQIKGMSKRLKHMVKEVSCADLVTDRMTKDSSYGGLVNYP